MVKRHHEEVAANSLSRKRARLPATSTQRNLLDLSDELLLRIFSHLSVPTLCICQTVSKRVSGIATDSQIWKEHYYNRFVRPRAVRVPCRKDAPKRNGGDFVFSSKLSKWLDEDNLVKRGRETNWKQQYKLRDNWSSGSCDVAEIPVAERPPRPPLLVRMHEGILLTADKSSGLRAWSARDERALLAGIRVDSGERGPPTSLAIDATEAAASTAVLVAVGFEGGGFATYLLDRSTWMFKEEYSHVASSNGELTALAFASPYLLTMTCGQLLSLYVFSSHGTEDGQLQHSARLLSSLKSHTAMPPLSLSVRPSASKITASVAYALPTFLGGWAVGIQEMQLSLSGEMLDTRLTSSGVHGAATLSSSLRASLSPCTQSGRPCESDTESIELHSSPHKPTSLSYSHPYLMLSHADNTLTLYLVSSTASKLSIGPGSRLWGHTSSVSSAHVSGKGKAVSVSLHGDELRIWELEGGLSSAAMRKRLGTGELSVRVRCGRKSKQDVEMIANGIAESREEEMRMTRGWVGFDEERVVVLREKSGSGGGQWLVMYDFR